MTDWSDVFFMFCATILILAYVFQNHHLGCAHPAEPDIECLAGNLDVVDGGVDE